MSASGAFVVDEAGDGRYVTLNIDRNMLAVPTADDHGYVFTNEEAAELLELLDAQIGEWAREMGRARRAVASGEPPPGCEWVEVDGEKIVMTTAEADDWLERDRDSLLHAGDQRRKEARENG